MSNEMIALGMILSFGLGGVVSNIILGIHMDRELSRYLETYRAVVSVYKARIRKADSAIRQHTRLLAQYRQLKAISNQRKELIEFMSQFLTPEEMDRVHHEKRGPKPSTRASEFTDMKQAIQSHVMNEIKVRRSFRLFIAMKLPGFVIEEDRA